MALFGDMPSSHILGRDICRNGFANAEALARIGLSHDQLAAAVVGTYRLLDRIDATLMSDGVDPLCQIVELANLSSMIGNILGAEVAKASHGLYVRNGPHKFRTFCLPMRMLCGRASKSKWR